MTEPLDELLTERIHTALPPARSRRQDVMVWGLFAAAVALATAVVVVWFIAAHANRQAEGAHRAAVANQAGLDQANQQLRSLGGTPVKTPAPQPTPTVTVTVQGQPGATGAAGPAPSIASIEAAVANYCTRTTCGTGPSAAQVAQAVATFCSSNGQCRGTPGTSGASGTSVTGPTGPTGPAGQSVTGPSGPAGADGQNASADQIASAVANYCGAHGGCGGADGEQGPAGENGQPGAPPVSWTYTDRLGGQHTCARTDPFDPSAPTYTCS